METSNYLEKPIIFVGFGRCGSSIISETILQHHKLAWISNYQQKFPSSSKINLLRNLFDNFLWCYRGQKNQLNQVSFFNTYLFRPTEAYQFWDTITGQNFAQSFLYGVKAQFEAKDKIRSFFIKLVKYQNRERLSFKITGPSRLTYLNSVFPDAKIIYIKRSPLPNIRSLLRVDFYQDRKHQLTWNQEGIYSERELEKIKEWKHKRPSYIAALQYYKVNEIFEKEKEQLGLEDRILEITYESFVKDSKYTVNKIMDFVGLECDGDMEEYLEEKKIYNRNRSEGYFLGKDLDRKILRIVNNGVEG